MAKETVTIWRCDLCGKQGEHYSEIAFTFCWHLTKRECCRECRASFDAWRESRKPKAPTAEQECPACVWHSREWERFGPGPAHTCKAKGER